jgi:hypothetical protein
MSCKLTLNELMKKKIFSPLIMNLFIGVRYQKIDFYDQILFIQMSRHLKEIGNNNQMI